MRARVSGVLLGVVAAGLGVLSPGSSAQAETVGLLPDSAVPAVTTRPRGRPVELGLRFRTSRPAKAVAVQFYKGSDNRGRHQGTLWSGKGKRLARVTFTGETDTGLQTARFRKPVRLEPHRIYVVSYSAPHGGYSVDAGFFTHQLANSPLSSRRNAGVYSHRLGSFPTRTREASSYGVDIVIRARRPKQSASTPTTATAPTVSPSGPGACASATPNLPDGPGPQGGCWPGAATTGIPAGVMLKRVPQDVTSAAQAGGANTGWTWDAAAGSIRITAAGATISAVDVSGGIVTSTIRPNMTVADTRIRCTAIDSGAFCGALGANSTMRDSEIGGGADGKTYINSQGFWVGDSSANNVISRVDIHHIVHGLHVDGGTTLEDSYIHDMPAGDHAGNDGGNGHSDGIFVSTGGHMTFRHNTFDQAANNCSIFVQDYDGTAEGIYDLTVRSSLFISTRRNGQASSFGVGIENKAITGADTIHVLDNVFSRGWEVAPIEAPVGSQVSGNSYVDGGAADIVWAR